MPNWIKNRVIAKDFEVLKKCLLNDKGEVDFNILKPMPEELNITSGGTSFVPPNRNSWSFGREIKDYDLILGELEKKYNKKLSQDEFIERVNEDDSLIGIISQNLKTEDETTITNYSKGFYNWKKYGYVDWYNWSISTWGTKWNACETEVYEESGVIEFQTAWSKPHGIFLEIAKHTPIRVEYADEDLGSNCGIVDFFKNKQGSQPGFVYIEDESIELAYDCWGYSEMDVWDENGDKIEDENNPKVIEANKQYFEVQEKLKELMDPLIAFGGNK